MNKIFDAKGPVLTKYGPEPTLRECIFRYYVSHGIDTDKAKQLTEDYIKNWELPE